MMLKSNNLSISQKLKAIILLACSLVIVIVSAVVFTLEWISFRSNILSNISTLTKVISANCTAAIAFQDPETAEEILSALAAEPHVLQANIYDTNEKVFARYERKNDAGLALSEIVTPGVFPKKTDSAGAQTADERHWFSKKYLDQ